MGGPQGDVTEHLQAVSDCTARKLGHDKRRVFARWTSKAWIEDAPRTRRWQVGDPRRGHGKRVSAGFRCLCLNQLDPQALAKLEQNLSRFGDSPPQPLPESMLDLTPDRIMDDLGIQMGDPPTTFGAYSIDGLQLSATEPNANRGSFRRRFSVQAIYSCPTAP
jgi:hypothetical protein